LRESTHAHTHTASFPLILTCTNLCTFSGGEDGFVRFYDPLLRIVAWFEDLGIGPINGIAFSAAPPAKLASIEAADTINRFMAPDFVVSTSSSVVVAVQVRTWRVCACVGGCLCVCVCVCVCEWA
jgi:hypothetical protein